MVEIEVCLVAGRQVMVPRLVGEGRLSRNYTVRVRLPLGPFERYCDIHDLVLLVNLSQAGKLYQPTGRCPPTWDKCWHRAKCLT